MMSTLGECLKQLKGEEPERYQYTLETLARHSYQGKCYKTLHALFKTDEWLHARFEGSNYTYEGFVSDLNVAWEQVAYIDTLRQVEAGEEPLALVQCVRYALIRTSINSLAENLVPELIFRAVEAEVWSTTRGLTHINNMPDPEQRVRAYANLLLCEKLHGQEREAARVRGIETALKLPERRGVGFFPRARALSVLVHMLDIDLMGICLDAHIAIRQYDQITYIRALDELFSRLRDNGGQLGLEIGLKALLAIKDEGNRWEVLSVLAGHLEGDLVAKGLEEALSIGNEKARAKVLSALAIKLEGDMVAKGLEGAHTIGNEKDRIQLLSALVGKLEGSLVKKGLEAALAISNQVERAHIVRDLVDKLEGNDKKFALDIALKIDDAKARAAAITALVDHFDDYYRGYILDKGLESAKVIRDADDRARALITLSDKLAGEERQNVLNQALKATLAIDYEASRAEVLIILAIRLENESQQYYLRNGLETALTVESETLRSHVLSKIARSLSGDLLKRAVDGANAMKSEQDRFRVLNALTDTQEEAVKRPMLELALDSVLAMTDFYRWRALLEIADKLDGDLLDRGIEAALSIDMWKEIDCVLNRLADRMDRDLLIRTLERAITIRDTEDCVNVLITLVNKLEDSERQHVLDRILEVALTIDRKPYRVQVLSVLAENFEGSKRHYVLDRGLEAAYAPGTYWDRLRMLSILADKLDDEAKQHTLTIGLELAIAEGSGNGLIILADHLEGDLLDRALDAAHAITDSIDRASALSAFAERFEGDKRHRTLESALDAAVIIDDESYLFAVQEKGALMYVLKGLVGKLELEQLERGLNTVATFDMEEHRLPFLIALADKLSGDERQHILESALETALSIHDEKDRANALSSLIKKLDGELLKQGMDAMLSIGYVQWSAEALSALAPYLDGELLASTLNAVLVIDNERQRTQHLSALAPYLEGELLASALNAVLGIGNEQWRVTALGVLAPKLEPNARLWALIKNTLNLMSDKREAVMRTLAIEAFWAPEVVSQMIVAAVVQQVQEICWEWRWQ